MINMIKHKLENSLKNKLQHFTCSEMRPQRCRSLPEVSAMVVAMAGGGLVFRLLQVQMSCDKACRVSIRSLINSHWNVSGLRGVLAACGDGLMTHMYMDT